MALRPCLSQQLTHGLAPSLDWKPSRRLTASAIKPRHAVRPLPSAVTAVTALAATAAPAAVWHAERRREMLRRHPELQRLRGADGRSLPLLILANALQLGLAIFAGQQLQQSPEAGTILAVLLLAVGVGGTLSLWSFSILHDLLHGTCVKVDRSTRENLLFWLSFPTIFGYHLYLQRGHLSHHKNLGRASMGQLFDSQRLEFEDGDVLFVAHRQPLQGQTFEVQLPGNLGTFSPSISHNVMTRFWDRSTESETANARAAKNAAWYCFSMVFERCALAINDKVVALFGRNAFFLQKPAAFHDSCATYARTAAVLHLFLWFFAGPGALLYLLLAEVAWQLPVHPACAMFVSNHGSGKRLDGSCAPSASLYVGESWGWFDWVCLFSIYHLEHHDFPDIPLLKLPELSRIAPEFYGREAMDARLPPPSLGVAPCATDWAQTVQRSFAEPEPYACSVVNGVDNEYAGEEMVAA